MNNNKKEIIGGVIWKFSERILAQVVSTVVAIVLARILGPAEYGSIALVSVFISFANMLMISGFNVSLIQKQNADNVDFSTVFFFNIGVSIALYGVTFAISGLVADFYAIPELKPVLQILGLSIPLTAVNSVQQAYVSRKMLFKRFFWSTLFGTLFSGVVGIYMAYRGFGVYALVAQTLVNTAVNTLVLWITVDWRPQLVFSLERLKGLFDYGWKLLVQNIVLNVYSSLRSLVIGKIYTTEDLAFYTKGNQYPNLIATNVDTAINSVLLPAMAKEQNDKERVKDMARWTTSLSSYIMSALLIGMAAVAEQFVELLLTEKWLPAVPFLRIACIVLLFVAPQTAMLQAVKAVGRSDIVLKADLPIRVFAFVVLLIAIPFGVIYIAISEVLTTVFGTVLYMVAAYRTVGYKPRELLADFLPNIAVATIMGVSVWQLGNILPFSTAVTLALQVSAGAVVYILLSVLTKNRSLLYMLRETGIAKRLQFRKNEK